MQIPGWLMKILANLAEQLAMLIAREVYAWVEGWAKDLSAKFGMKPDPQMKANIFNQKFVQRCESEVVGTPTAGQVNFLREWVHQEHEHPELAVAVNGHEFPGPIKFTPPHRMPE